MPPFWTGTHTAVMPARRRAVQGKGWEGRLCLRCCRQPLEALRGHLIPSPREREVELRRLVIAQSTPTSE